MLHHHGVCVLWLLETTMSCYTMLHCVTLYYVHRLVRRHCMWQRGTGILMCWLSSASRVLNSIFRTMWVPGPPTPPSLLHSDITFFSLPPLLILLPSLPPLSSLLLPSPPLPSPPFPTPFKGWGHSPTVCMLAWLPECRRVSHTGWLLTASCQQGGGNSTPCCCSERVLQYREISLPKRGTTGHQWQCTYTPV